MNKGLPIFAVLLGLLFLGGVVFGGFYVNRRNTMVQQKEAITAAWAQVDTVIQRRADLIPNLVETVRGIADQERDVFIGVAEARAKVAGSQTPADTIAANDQLSGALSRLLLVVERYPDLKSNQNFIRLQDELAGTENRIAVERRRYNQTVQDYNTYIQLFPNNLVAGMSGFAREEAYFRTSEEARQAPPPVNFSRDEAAPAPAQ